MKTFNHIHLVSKLGALSQLLLLVTAVALSQPPPSLLTETRVAPLLEPHPPYNDHQHEFVGNPSTHRCCYLVSTSSSLIRSRWVCMSWLLRIFLHCLLLCSMLLPHNCLLVQLRFLLRLLLWKVWIFRSFPSHRPLLQSPPSHCLVIVFYRLCRCPL